MMGEDVKRQARTYAIMPPWLRSRQLRHNRYRLFTVAGGGIVNDKARLAGNVDF